MRFIPSPSDSLISARSCPSISEPAPGGATSAAASPRRRGPSCPTGRLRNRRTKNVSGRLTMGAARAGLPSRTWRSVSTCGSTPSTPVRPRPACRAACGQPCSWLELASRSSSADRPQVRLKPDPTYYGIVKSSLNANRATSNYLITRLPNYSITQFTEGSVPATRAPPGTTRCCSEASGSSGPRPERR